MRFEKDARKRRIAEPQPKFKAEFQLQHFVMLFRGLFEIFLQYGKFLWDQNPMTVLFKRHQRLLFVQNYEEVTIQPRLCERVLQIFMSDNRRRRRLLNWVRKKIGSHTPVEDFSGSWHDGIALCALLESICPGVCPSYHLLSGVNRVKNCRLGLKLANKYLYVPMDLISAEEIAIATKATEPKVIQYVSMVKWASENIKDKWSALHESLIAAKTGRCFVKGPGLKSGIVDKRSKLTILVSDTIGVFNILIEVRGPYHEFCGERIVSLHQAKSCDSDANGLSENIKYLEDCAGNTFVRKKVPSHYDASFPSDPIQMDIQCGEEGTFYVCFVPKRAGMHTLTVKWQNHHVENSPFRIKVYKASNLSTKNMKGAEEKRVIYDSLSVSGEDNVGTTRPGILVHTDDTSDLATKPVTSSSQKAYSKGRQLTVTRRRVLRRIITRNGEDIVIEDSISPSLSRQSSINDVSDEDCRHLKSDTDEIRNSEVSARNSPTCSRPINLTAVPEEKRQSKDMIRVSNLETVLSTQSPISKCYVQSDEEEQKRRHVEYVSSTSFERSDEQGTSAQSQNDSDTSVRSRNRTPAKRAPLQRFSSIHPYKKKSARRTKSADQWHKATALINQSAERPELSDTSSEISSDGVHAVIEENKGRALKVLHSGSMKKACMYMCDKTLTHTMSSMGNPSFAEESFLFNEDQDSQIPLKPLLRETQSLPLMRTFWQRNAHYTHDVIFDTHHTNSDFHPNNDQRIRRAKSHQSLSREQPSFGCSLSADDSCQSSVIPTNQSGFSNQRIGLTRQCPVFSKASSDSVSDKTESNSESNRKNRNKGRKSEFKNIEPQGRDKDSKNNVSLIAPKATVDKSTQVSDKEIIQETNWDLFECVYLLLRRISIKVPCSIPVGAEARHLSNSSQTKDEATSRSRECTRSVGSEMKKPSGSASNSLSISAVNIEQGKTDNCRNSDLLADGSQRGSDHEGVNAWLDRHDQLLRRQEAPLHRQVTRETEDSGFDDNPANFSRHGRLSLPSVLTANGHVKLHRRPYRGPQMALDPRLVNSNSSASLSLDDQERGNEADDENFPNLGAAGVPRQQRRRHRRVHRSESFSFSDSEIHERRKRIKRRSNAVCHTVSRADDILPARIRTFGEALFVSRAYSKYLSFRRYPTLASRDQSLENLEDDDHLQQPEVGLEQEFQQPTIVTKSNPPVLKDLTSTSESVESNYKGFGVSKPNRSELLSHVNAFQKLCPTEEESTDDNILQQPKIIHWQDENEFISCSDRNPVSNESETNDDTESDSMLNVQQPDRKLPNDEENTSSMISSPIRRRLCGVSNFYDIHSTSRTSCELECAAIDDTENQDDLVGYGDVVSMATDDGSSRMTVRLAGAGLRRGTVGANNSFQVWVENPVSGSLTVTVDGAGPHTVTETSVLYTGDNLYEVSYGVTQPGLYKIYVKWANKNLTEQPYVCEITL